MATKNRPKTNLRFGSLAHEHQEGKQEGNGWLILALTRRTLFRIYVCPASILTHCDIERWKTFTVRKLFKSLNLIQVNRVLPLR